MFAKKKKKNTLQKRNIKRTRVCRQTRIGVYDSRRCLTVVNINTADECVRTRDLDEYTRSLPCIGQCKHVRWKTDIESVEPNTNLRSPITLDAVDGVMCGRGVKRIENCLRDKRKSHPPSPALYLTYPPHS